MKKFIKKFILIFCFLLFFLSFSDQAFAVDECYGELTEKFSYVVWGDVCFTSDTVEKCGSHELEIGPSDDFCFDLTDGSAVINEFNISEGYFSDSQINDSYTEYFFPQNDPVPWENFYDYPYDTFHQSLTLESEGGCSYTPPAMVVTNVYSVSKTTSFNQTGDCRSTEEELPPEEEEPPLDDNGENDDCDICQALADCALGIENLTSVVENLLGQIIVKIDDLAATIVAEFAKVSTEETVIEPNCNLIPSNYEGGLLPSTDDLPWCEYRQIVACPSDLFQSEPLDEVFLVKLQNKFPLDILSGTDLPALVTSEVAIDLFGESHDITFFFDAISSLRIPAVISFIVWIIVAL